MSENIISIAVPHINPNETEALLAALYVQEGQAIAAGDLLCTLETTKATADVPAEAGGFVIGLRYEQGQTVPFGETLCYLADSPTAKPPELPRPNQNAHTPGLDELPEGLRITQPALALARQHSLALETLSRGPLVTEAVVRSMIEQQAGGPHLSPPPADFDPTAILVYGGGGHGKSLIDLLRLLGAYRLVGVIDDGLAQAFQSQPDAERPTILGLPVLGGAEALAGLKEQGVRLAVNAVGGIGNLAIRIKVFERLAQAGFTCPAVVHPTAFVEPSASLSAGVQVFPHAYVGSEAHLGYGCIVNTGAIVSHDCHIGNYANISPGAMLAGEVEIGSGVLVGMGVTVNLQVKIGAGARIGNGATIKSDVPEKGIVRAGSVWPE